MGPIISCSNCKHADPVEKNCELGMNFKKHQGECPSHEKVWWALPRKERDEQWRQENPEFLCDLAKPLRRKVFKI